MKNKFETIYKVGEIKEKYYMEIFRFNEKKFRIKIEHSSGNPCGFNTKCCLAVMVPDGTFHNLVDNHDLNVLWTNSYLRPEGDVLVSNMNRIAQMEFQEYVKKVYGE